MEQKVCRETVKKVGDNISKSFPAKISCFSIELIPMLLLEGVQAGGKEEEGEGSERGSHLRVQDRAQDGVRRSEGEEVESAVGLDNPIVQYAVSRNMQQGVVCALQVYLVCSFRCLTRRMSARSSRGASARRSPSRSARLLLSK